MKKKMFDLSVKRRRYFSNECGLQYCPECGAELLEENCTILLGIVSKSDEAESMTNLSGSHFCNQCLVVVFNNEKLEKAAKILARGHEDLHYFVAGIINMEAIPLEKRHIPMGIKDNPIPLVEFLPALSKTVIAAKKTGRNEPCPCGSARKYKHCCGK